jgi:TRAP-type C4-dicarboxylate transport system permease small subunit
MERIQRMLAGLIRGIEWIAVICLVLMVTLVFFNAFSRYVFSYGLNQVEELSRFAFIYLSFLGVAVAYHRKGHIVIPLLVDKLRGKTRKIVECCTRIIVTATFVFFLYSSWLYTLNTLSYKSHGTGIIFGFIAVAGVIMAGCILLVDIVSLLEFFWRKIIKKRSFRNISGTGD